MRNLLILIFTLFIVNSAQAREVTILAANATSSAAGSVDVTCLLNDDCIGSWQPESRDEGVDEGLYLQFDESISINTIDIVLEKKGIKRERPSFRLYLNGKTSSPSGVNFSPYWADQITKTIRFSNPRTLHPKTKSVFIKIDKSWAQNPIKPKVLALRFYVKKGKNSNSNSVLERIQFKLPLIVKASLKASSILPPETAYSPTNLFDSKYDFAWSTNGKSTNGIGETLEINFNNPQSIFGLYVWNGYQRSTTHFRKNGSVKTMILESDGGRSQTFELTQKLGLQKINLKKPLLNVSNLKLKIKSVFPGTKYRDVLISELRLINQKNQIVLPQVYRSKIKTVPELNNFLDYSWSGFIHGFSDECSYTCFNKRIRLRSNGTFVIYRDFEYGKSNDGSTSANVLEGNWVIEKDKRLRIFGKRYTTELTSSTYLQSGKNKSVPTATIFQSYVSIHRFNNLTKKKQQNVVSYLLNRNAPPTESPKYIGYNLTCEYVEKGGSYPTRIKGETLKEIRMKLIQFLKKKNPYYLKSSVFTDVVLPTSQVNSCRNGC